MKGHGVAERSLALLLCTSAFCIATDVIDTSAKPEGSCGDEVSLLQSHPGMVKLGSQRTDPLGNMTSKNVVSSERIRKDRLESDSSGIDMCLRNTGGICGENLACPSLHGKSTCDRGRCLCRNGCSGADSICRDHKYKVILEDFTIQNFRFGTFLMSTQDPTTYGHNVLTMSQHNTSDRNHFKLIEAHDGAYIIYSKADPDYVITIEKEEKCKDKKDHVKNAHQKLPCDGQITWNVVQTRATGEFQRHPRLEGQVSVDDMLTLRIPSVPSLGLTLTAPPGGYNDTARPKGFAFHKKRPVMLQSYLHPRHFLYFGRGTSSTLFDPSDKRVGEFPDIHYDDPGDGGLWIFDPPLPEDVFKNDGSKLKTYIGDVCTFNCHGTHAVWSGQPSFWNTALIVGAIVTACLVCCICGCCLRVMDCI